MVAFPCHDKFKIIKSSRTLLPPSQIPQIPLKSPQKSKKREERKEEKKKFKILWKEKGIKRRILWVLLVEGGVKKEIFGMRGDLWGGKKGEKWNFKGGPHGGWGINNEASAPF